MNKQTLVKMARKSESFEQLAQLVNYKDTSESGMEKFVKQVSKQCPGIETILEAVECERLVQEAIRNEEDFKTARLELIEKVDKMNQAGYSMKGETQEELNDEPERPKQKVQQVTLDDLKGRTRMTIKSEDQLEGLKEQLQPLDQDVKCEVVASDVLGYTGDTYKSRKIVVYVQRPRIFGEEVVDKMSIRLCTIHKGVLNLGAMRDEPTSAWMALDMMSELGKFTRDDVLKKVSEVHGVKGQELKDVEYRYNELKNHHLDTSKRYLGMVHMVEDLNTLEGGGCILRGRQAYETLEYFLERESKLKGAKVGKNPVMSL